MSRKANTATPGGKTGKHREKLDRFFFAVKNHFRNRNLVIGDHRIACMKILGVMEMVCVFFVHVHCVYFYSQGPEKHLVDTSRRC